MPQSNRLSAVYAGAAAIAFDRTSKIALLSDCHRGDGTLADNFDKNKNLYFAALSRYWHNGYTLIELGDGDELWENASMDVILRAHGDVFWRLAQFYRAGRIHFLYGNHDMQKRKGGAAFQTYYDERKQTCLPLFPGVAFHEGLILRESDTGLELFLVHGHQGDCINDRLWRLGRFLVRYIWKPLQLIGVHDPFSASANDKRGSKIELGLKKWAGDNQRIVVAGHTHRQAFAQPQKSLYFNDGCCVRSSAITAIEICGGQIALVKWRVMTRPDGTLFVGRQVQNGPVDIARYYERTS